MASTKSIHGVVVATEPGRIVARRRTFTVSAFPAPVSPGDVVRFVPEGGTATRIKLVPPKPVRARRYPVRLDGIVTKTGHDWATLRDLPSLEEFHRDGGETAIGGPLHVGDPVRFTVMANDSMAWEVMLRSVKLPADLAGGTPER